MADDVRARAEFEAWWGPHPTWYKIANGTRLCGVAFDAWKASRAALAVAPATAQPVAWAVFAEDASVPAYVSASRNRADRVVDSEAGRIEGYRVVPLYAAPPATGDAATVRDAVRRIVRGAARAGAIDAPDDKNYSGFTEKDASRCAERVLESMEDDIAALPLPAPATAVEEARATGKQVVVALIEWAAPKIASKNGALRQEGYAVMRALKETIDKDGLAAAEAAATHAAKESRSDDRPAKGQGGV